MIIPIKILDRFALNIPYPVLHEEYRKLTGIKCGRIVFVNAVTYQAGDDRREMRRKMRKELDAKVARINENSFQGNIRPWTKEEIDQLIELKAQDWPWKHIVAKIGRTKSALYQKWSKLNAVEF